MFQDARQIAAGTSLPTDVCIVGAGAAGITLAWSLRDAGFRVLVLESGGLEFEEPTQALYAGENLGLPDEDPQTTRLRFFGGSTNHWAGWCRPLEPEDFSPADPADLRAWPLRRAELDPYYRTAQTLCELRAIQLRRPGALAEGWRRAGAGARSATVADGTVPGQSADAIWHRVSRRAGAGRERHGRAARQCSGNSYGCNGRSRGGRACQQPGGTGVRRRGAHRGVGHGRAGKCPPPAPLQPRANRRPGQWSRRGRPLLHGSPVADRSGFRGLRLSGSRPSALHG